MNRLGFDLEELPQLIVALKQYPYINPVAIFSHLAAADSNENLLKRR